MYVRNFREIETLMYGHQEGFEQLSAIQHRDGFNLAFSAWLTEKKDTPTGAGWANAIEELAKSEGKDPFETLSENVVLFFDDWGD
ncbi:hypothetical protein ACYFX5_06995 [Bremerella sp. T1]|uniref:hypothetical protein n=1 Tax=Bremerella sp. TYQ1 TaxID=3119568 RepID=UPI001CCE5152|nr:hypothetical protein [Bremerella volcania]UBM38003.1 hypothetical protein LA756_08930 [Bremerella volcania]